MLIQVSDTEAGIVVKALLAVSDQLILTGSVDAAESLREITGNMQAQIDFQQVRNERRPGCLCYKWDESCPDHPNNSLYCGNTPEGK